MSWFIQASYFSAAVLFIYGLKRMSSPVTARKGIVWAGVGMVLATLVTFFHGQIHTNYVLMFLAITIGGGAAWWSGKRVAMTDMPQMIALYNGMGGGAAAAIAAVELVKGEPMTQTVNILAVLGALIGTIAFSGSGIAFGKLQGLIRKATRFPNQQLINLSTFVVTVLLGLIIIQQGHEVSGFLLFIFFALALAVGVMMTLPIGGADMPVVISLFNALTGLAVGFEGYVLQNPAMMIAGIVVGSAGTLLTQLMAKAMNRPISNVLFSNFGDTGGSGEGEEVTGTMKPIEATDVAVMMAFADKVIIVPGYGMAVAQAQHKVWELTQILQDRGVAVKFAIHPVAGRMPGHMNVLLAEAGVPYDIIYDLDEINNEFATADVALVIGANDVVNPAARSNPDSPIFGMPILNADQAKNVIVIKRGQGSGFSGIENLLFYADNTRMLYGDGQAMVGELISSIKEL
ncbi:MAG TPA: NAD(P)(+) transhydrogenase (Re/Si-specific) subunit beta [Gammaproteobacteria bacterium]|nr:NAD(P)(+) transhydrogenase (Re/Si-specific) subunit beta [Gammaproteobacteria bacterium]